MSHLTKKNKLLLLGLGFLIASISAYRFEKLNFSSIQPANISGIYPKAVLLKSPEDNNVWMINNNKKRLIASADIFNKLGLSWNNIQLVQSSEIDRFPSAKLVKTASSPETYYLTDTGYKYHIQNQDIFSQNNFSWQDIETISQDELNSYATTNLIRATEDFKIYTIENGQKRWITSPEVFEKLYDWKMVLSSNDLNIDSYPQGENIEAALWIDTPVVQPLQNIQIGMLLSSSTPFTIKIKNDQGKIEYEENIPAINGTILDNIPAGGKLGKKTIYLEDSKKMISAQVPFEIKAETKITTGLESLDNFYPQVKKWMLQDISYYDGAKGYRSPDTNLIWLRDHIHQSQGFCYWEEDIKSTLDWFFKTQIYDGGYYDFCPGAKIEVETDLEYLMVLGTYQAWQATGDTEWMISHLDQLDKGLFYYIAKKNRWDLPHMLIKRPFTIDTWDFQWYDGSIWINDRTSFGIMSGDNSGFYEASLRLSEMFGKNNNIYKENYWKNLAGEIKERSNKYLWNEGAGYYQNILHLDAPSPAVEVDENSILSFSNVYNLNRADFVSHDKAARIIQAYQDRAQTARWNGQPVFQEWFSVYPDYGNNKWGTRSADESGEYVNGGIMPLVGGELSKAAFEHGYESYGLQELLQYIDLTRRQGNKTYLWYWPDGRPGISGKETIATDGWGSSAFLSAFIEGLVGIKDLSTEYEIAQIAPRWTIAKNKEANAVIKYGASDGYVAYNWQINQNKKQITITYTDSGSKANFHVLLPTNTMATAITLNKNDISFVNHKIEQSNYADFNLDIDYVGKVVIDYR